MRKSYYEPMDEMNGGGGGGGGTVEGLVVNSTKLPIGADHLILVNTSDELEYTQEALRIISTHGAEASKILKTDEDGFIEVAEPENSANPTTKEYVDALLKLKLNNEQVVTALPTTGQKEHTLYIIEEGDDKGCYIWYKKDAETAARWLQIVGDISTEGLIQGLKINSIDVPAT